jgi:hypothetical protein
VSDDAHGGGSALVLVGTLLVAQLVVPLLLFAWGRTVARRRAGERQWRWVSRLPLVTLAISALGYVVPLLGIVGSTRVADTASRAGMLARAIASGMNVGAVTLALSLVVWVGSSIALAYGAFGGPPR